MRLRGHENEVLYGEDKTVYSTGTLSLHNRLPRSHNPIQIVDICASAPDFKILDRLRAS